MVFGTYLSQNIVEAIKQADAAMVPSNKIIPPEPTPEKLIRRDFCDQEGNDAKDNRQ